MSTKIEVFHHAICTGSQHSDLLLVGQGPFVKIFSLNQCSLLSNLQAFESQAVHGISFSSYQKDSQEGLYIVWGGRSLALLRLGFSEDDEWLKTPEKVATSPEHFHNDWILDARFVPSKTQATSKIIFLNAHNDLYILEARDSLDSWTDPTVTCLAKGPPAALYCGHIKVSSKDSLLIASGTVFGGVVLWSVNTNGSQTAGNVIHYSGHDGSVFDIKLLQIQVAGTTQSVIVSCSDDRTVKIWGVPDDNVSWQAMARNVESGTGFSNADSQPKVNLPLISGAAHLSRIWRVAADLTGSGTDQLISCGEDATIQIWKIDGDGQHLNLVKSRALNLHAGKNIWAGALISGEPSNGGSNIITGGADGRISVTNVEKSMTLSASTLSDSRPNFQQRIESQDTKELGDTPNEPIRNYCWLGYERLLGVSADGSIYLGDIGQAKSAIRWSLIRKITALARYTITARIDHNLALIASDTDHIFLFCLDDLSFAKVSLAQKMQRRRISFLSGVFIRLPDQDLIRFGYQCLGSSSYCQVTLEAGNVIKETEMANLPSGFIITSALGITGWIVILGSRNGQLAFCRSPAGADCTSLVIEEQVHNKEAITSIHEAGHHGWIVTTGRDGTFRIHETYQETDYKVRSRIVLSSRLPFGPDIEGAEIIDGDLHVWGFRGTELVLWSHSLQQELWSIDVGGRHRSWCFLHGMPASSLAWSRAGQTLATRLESGNKLLQQGTHGREIKAMVIRHQNDELGKLIATGAEDTCIRLSRYSSKQGLNTIEVMPHHTTGIQKLAWSHDGHLLFSAAGNEEFFIWLIQPVPVVGVGVQLIAKCPAITDTRILRVMDFDMTIVDKESYHITMVYADSSIRTWLVSTSTYEFELVTKAVYTTRCITQCKIVDDYLFTAATDGFIVLWKRIGLAQISKKHLHQSSVKCLDIVKRDGLIILATGGDDNALALTILDLTTTPSWQTLVIPSAHAAAINGLVFLPVSGDSIRLVTTSNDQRVKTWRLRLEGSNHSRRLLVDDLSVSPSSVADASCVDLLRKNDETAIVMAGVGMEVWNVDEMNKVDKLEP